MKNSFERNIAHREKWENKYGQEGYHKDMFEPDQTMVKFLEDYKEEILSDPENFVLDLGAGNGRNSFPALEMGMRVEGIEISKEAIKQAKKKIEEDKALRPYKEKISFTQGTFTDLPYQKESFKAIISNATLQCIDLEDREKTFSEISRVLKDGGLFKLRVRSSSKKEDKPAHYEKEEIEKLAAENLLKIEDIDKQEREDEEYSNDTKGMWVITFRKKENESRRNNKEN